MTKHNLKTFKIFKVCLTIFQHFETWLSVRLQAKWLWV